ncbi:MAG: hypothetical protein M5T52_07475 [Ignavibacteriaceae bacterium]|nr:hypothetical protein [Ignavibacteriaceae bacterium]
MILNGSGTISFLLVSIILMLSGENSPTKKIFPSNLPNMQVSSRSVTLLRSKKDFTIAFIFEQSLMMNFISSYEERLNDTMWLSVMSESLSSL